MACKFTTSVTETMPEYTSKQRKESIQIGEDLYGVSIAQLEERREFLRAEMARIDSELEKKKAERDAAEDIFRKA